MRRHLVYINGINSCKNGVPASIKQAFADCFVHHVANPTLSFVSELEELTATWTHAAVGTGSLLGLLAFVRAGGAVDGTDSWLRNLYYTVGSALQMTAEFVAHDLCRMLTSIANKGRQQGPVTIVAHSHGGWALLRYLASHALPEQVDQLLIVGSPVTVHHPLAHNICFETDPICGLFDPFVDEVDTVSLHTAACCDDRVSRIRKSLFEFGVHSSTVLRVRPPSSSNLDMTTDGMLATHAAKSYGLYLLRSRCNATARIVSCIVHVLECAIATFCDLVY